LFPILIYGAISTVVVELSAVAGVLSLIVLLLSAYVFEDVSVKSASEHRGHTDRLKQEYIDGELTLTEYEQRLEQTELETNP
jgi:uncharacterized membrane protein